MARVGHLFLPSEGEEGQGEGTLLTSLPLIGAGCYRCKTHFLINTPSKLAVTMGKDSKSIKKKLTFSHSRPFLRDQNQKMHFWRTKWKAFRVVPIISNQFIKIYPFLGCF